METYIVKLDYKKPDGFWVISHEETVVVKGGKSNHQKAAEIAKTRFPGCRVKRIDFC